MIQAGDGVVDISGLRGRVETVRGPEAGGSGVVVLFAGGQRVKLPVDLLASHADGTYRVPFSVLALQTNPPGAARPDVAWVFPLMKEELSIEKRVVDIARVRVTKSVHEEVRTVDETLWREEVSVELVEVNRVVDGPVAVRQEGDLLIVPLLEEVLVVEKRLLLREELRINRRRSQVQSRQNVTLRSESASIEREPISGPSERKETQE